MSNDMDLGMTRRDIAETALLASAVTDDRTRQPDLRDHYGMTTASLQPDDELPMLTTQTVGRLAWGPRDMSARPRPVLVSDRTS
jgi:hypothetical protein